jgi:hypothetical protein
MNPQAPVKYSIAYKWLSYCLVLGFVYYWLFTLGLLFFDKSIHESAPRLANLHQAFSKQTWRLFAYTTLYNRELELIVRDKNNPSKTDTVQLVQYSIAQKRNAAPFNDFYDGFDQLLFWMLNDIEAPLLKQDKLLKAAFPGRQDSFYRRRSNLIVLSDSLHPEPLQNLENYGRYVMRQLKKDTAGKEFQLLLLHKFIPPAHPPAGSLAEGYVQTSFISNFKSF